jgi:hypothetical protein
MKPFYEPILYFLLRPFTVEAMCLLKALVGKRVFRNERNKNSGDAMRYLLLDPGVSDETK